MPKRLNNLHLAPILLLALAASSSLEAQHVNIIEHPVYTDCDPGGITNGPDGALWFTQIGSATIGRMTTAGALTEYPIPNKGGNGITSGSDGALWFTEAANNIGRITTSGVVTEFPIPTPNAGANGITAGPDGALWFTEATVNQVARVTTTGVFTEFPVPHSPNFITSGPDGALWYTGELIGRITTAGAVTEYEVISRGLSVGTWGITAGPDGALWFTEPDENVVGRISTGGVVTQYVDGSSTGGGGGITTGPGGLWFSTNRGTIGSVTTSGVFSSYGLLANYTATWIALGSDGSLWATERYAANPATAGIFQTVKAVASLSVTPSSGAINTPVTLAGSGFGSSETVNIFAHSTSGDLIATAIADTTGAFSVQANVGDAAEGQLSLAAVGQFDSRIGIAQFSVSTLVELTPSSGPPGTNVKVAVLNLPGGQKVNLFLGSMFLGTAQASGGGAFDFDFTVPANVTSGGYSVIGRVNGQIILTSVFEVN